jgi:transketolase
LQIACAHANANVKIIAGMPGLMCPYGATHQATDDIAILKMIPGLTIIDPPDATELKQVVKAIADIPGTVYVRGLRGNVSVVLDPGAYAFEIGKAKLLLAGSDVGIITSGFMTERGLQASKEAAGSGIRAALRHVPTIKPFDGKAIQDFAAGVKRLVVIENHQTTGGLATLVIEALYDAGINMPVMKIGIGKRFYEAGSQAYVEEKYGLDYARILRAVVTGK